MNFLSVALYLTAVGLALATLYFGYLLHRKFQCSFLLTGLYYLIAFFAAGLIDLVGRYLAAQLMGIQPAEVVLLLRHVFVFLMFPFVPLALYLFMSYVTQLIEEKVSPTVLIIFAAFWALFFLTLVVTTKNVLGGRDTGFSDVLFAFLGRTTLGFFLLISGFLWWKSKKFEDVRQKRSVRLLGLAYLSGFAAYFAASEMTAASSSSGRPIAIFLYFSLNLPPLFVLRSFLVKFQPRIDVSAPLYEAALEDLFETRGLSKREQEIVRLILEGKSNKDITRELYISLHTVKNHTYHIYQKLGVKNRLQITRLVRDRLRNKPD
ncbi:MAG: helix-turn-helix transcriptional regulator [Candidatus Aminicenantes bacterium]|nr:helix-turn-helix transcriptional regulator [Candidatus Aminicenantes bacterium]